MWQQALGMSAQGIKCGSYGMKSIPAFALVAVERGVSSAALL